MTRTGQDKFKSSVVKCIIPSCNGIGEGEREQENTRETKILL